MFKIGSVYHNSCDTIEPYLIGKGGGSAYGGEWKPSKPEDYRLFGKPGVITVTDAKVRTMIGRSILKSHIRITGAMNIPMAHQSLRLLEVLS